MIITSSDPKYYLGRSGKGLITYMGLKINVRFKKMSRYAITNVIMKYHSKIIKEFEKSPYKGYASKSPKHEPTYSYFT